MGDKNPSTGKLIAVVGFGTLGAVIGGAFGSATDHVALGVILGGLLAETGVYVVLFLSDQSDKDDDRAL